MLKFSCSLSGEGLLLLYLRSKIYIMVQTKEIFDGRYTVYSDGRVYSNNQRKGFLTPQKTKRGYLRVYLRECKSSKLKPHLIHRLVAECFIPNTNNLPQIDHIDNDKTNNNVDNLQWINSRGNTLKRSNSEFPGVYFHIIHKKYISQVHHNHKNIYLGRFNTPEEASAAYWKYREDNNIV